MEDWELKYLEDGELSGLSGSSKVPVNRHDPNQITKEEWESEMEKHPDIDEKKALENSQTVMSSEITTSKLLLDPAQDDPKPIERVSSTLSHMTNKTAKIPKKPEPPKQPNMVWSSYWLAAALVLLFVINVARE